MADWRIQQDAQSKPYYINLVTNAFSWEKPVGYIQPTVPKHNGGWIKEEDGNGAEYYYHVGTGGTQWEKPNGYIDDKLPRRGSDASSPKNTLVSSNIGEAKSEIGDKELIEGLESAASTSRLRQEHVLEAKSPHEEEMNSSTAKEGKLRATELDENDQSIKDSALFDDKIANSQVNEDEVESKSYVPEAVVEKETDKYDESMARTARDLTINNEAERVNTQELLEVAASTNSENVSTDTQELAIIDPKVDTEAGPAGEGAEPTVTQESEIVNSSVDDEKFDYNIDDDDDESESLNTEILKDQKSNAGDSQVLVETKPTDIEETLTTDSSIGNTAELVDTIEVDQQGVHEVDSSGNNDVEQTDSTQLSEVKQETNTQPTSDHAELESNDRDTSPDNNNNNSNDNTPDTTNEGGNDKTSETTNNTSSTEAESVTDDNPNQKEWIEMYDPASKSAFFSSGELLAFTPPEEGFFTVSIAGMTKKQIMSIVPKAVLSAITIQCCVRRSQASDRAKVALGDRLCAHLRVGSEEWVELMDLTSSKPFWYNSATRTWTWQRPDEVLPCEWIMLYDPQTRRPYFYNNHTEVTTFEAPEEYSRPNFSTPNHAKNIMNVASWSALTIQSLVRRRLAFLKVERKKAGQEMKRQTQIINAKAMEREPPRVLKQSTASLEVAAQNAVSIQCMYRRYNSRREVRVKKAGLVLEYIASVLETPEKREWIEIVDARLELSFYFNRIDCMTVTWVSPPHRSLLIDRDELDALRRRADVLVRRAKLQELQLQKQAVLDSSSALRRQAKQDRVAFIARERLAQDELKREESLNFKNLKLGGKTKSALDLEMKEIYNKAYKKGVQEMRLRQERFERIVHALESRKSRKYSEHKAAECDIWILIGSCNPTYTQVLHALKALDDGNKDAKPSAAPLQAPRMYRRATSRTRKVDAVNDYNAEGETMLHCACVAGNDNAVQALLACGANVTRRDGTSRRATALHDACEMSCPRQNIIDMLLRGSGAQAAVVMTDSSGETPVHCACRTGRRFVLERLLTVLPEATNLALTLKNAKGRTPGDLAKRKGHVQIQRLLAMHGNRMGVSPAAKALGYAGPATSA